MRARRPGKIQIALTLAEGKLRVPDRHDADVGRARAFDAENEQSLEAFLFAHEGKSGVKGFDELVVLVRLDLVLRDAGVHGHLPMGRLAGVSVEGEVYRRLRPEKSGAFGDRVRHEEPRG